MTHHFMKSRFLFLTVLAASALAAEPTLTIDAGKAAAKSSPMLYGLMTEEINHSYDGGLYAELIQNRAFADDAKQPVHWAGLNGAKLALDPTQPLNTAIKTSLRIDIPAAGGGVTNEGYWGFPVWANTQYRAHLFAKAASGFDGPLSVTLESLDGGTVYARAEVPHLTESWKDIELTLTTGGEIKSTTQARLAVTAQKSGTVWLGFASLFPPTWKDRPNGLRRDLMQMLVDLKPAFLRFPGGNYLEGNSIATRFDWKKTLGPIWERAGHPCPWGYRSSDGLGLLEFLEWCEDMGAEPVLAVYAGYSLDGAFVRAGSDLVPYVNDALDEIEYLTGSATTPWGARRVKDGHPAPFKLHYVEVGNEDFFDKSGSYDGRFAQFHDAIKAKYPQIDCISTVGFEHPENQRVHSRKAAVLDEHYYSKAAEFLKVSTNTYEKYDRAGPKIFVGEWAAYETPFAPWEKGSEKEPPTPNFLAALGDSAWMAAMERNSDIVVMQCYAPLFVNVNAGARQWRPDLIGYDALHAFGSPSYYAIQMFSTNRGDEILKATFGDSPLQGSVIRDSTTGTVFVKIVNPSGKTEPLKIDLQGGPAIASNALVTTFSADPAATTSFDDPKKVAPVVSEVSGIGASFNYTFAPNSITVLKLSAR
jgi:alpha-N-arabinofuranosidase